MHTGRLVAVERSGLLSTMKHTTSSIVAALLFSAPLAAAQVENDRGPSNFVPRTGPAVDDLTQVAPAWQSLLEFEARGERAPTALGAPESGNARFPIDPGVAPAKPIDTTRGHSVESRLEAPLYRAYPETGELFARVRGMKAQFDADGLTVYPVFGRAAAQSYSVAFDLDSVVVGGKALGLGQGATPMRNGDRITLAHGAVREVHNVTLDGVEQTFVFDALPTGGDLVVDLDVETNLTPVVDGAALRFEHETLGGVTYGDAFVLDATGRRAAIERVWTGDSIELTVPAAFLANATFPVTIDPVVTSFTSGSTGTIDDSEPDLCYAGQHAHYWLAWEDYVSATDADVYVAYLTTVGTWGGQFFVDASTDSWETPAIAYQYGNDQALVVASTVDGSGLGRIKGQLIDCSGTALVGTTIDISTYGALKVHPDVGGESFTGTISNFCVVWSSVWTAGTSHQVQYAVVDQTGAPGAVTSLTTLGEVHNEPSISQSTGDTAQAGQDWWTFVWIQDDDDNGQGNVLARRVDFTGDISGTTTLTVSAAANASAPCVTSQFDRALIPSGQRPSLVVYVLSFTSSSGTTPTQRSLYANVIDTDNVYGPNAISTTLEDFDFALDQFEPTVAGDGNCYYIAYSEVYYAQPNSSDRDTYMLSGCLSDLSTGSLMALAERHQNMSFTGSDERKCSVATRRDGDQTMVNDDGMVMWERRNQPNGAELYGYTLEIPTLNQSVTRAVGRQFCDANPHSGGGSLGRQSSWTWLEGNQSTTSTHFLYCVDMPLNTFALAISALTTTNVNMAGGGEGRLCLSSAGRYNNQIQSSGSNGATTFVIDPTSIPLPTGNVAASVGQTWYFQVWHRDFTSGGAATSNFSSAVSMQFTN